LIYVFKRLFFNMGYFKYILKKKKDNIDIIINMFLMMFLAEFV